MLWINNLTLVRCTLPCCFISSGSCSRNSCFLLLQHPQLSPVDLTHCIRPPNQPKPPPLSNTSNLPHKLPSDSLSLHPET